MTRLIYLLVRSHHLCCQKHCKRDEEVDRAGATHVEQAGLRPVALCDVHLREPGRGEAGQLYAVVLLLLFVGHVLLAVPVGRVLQLADEKILVHEHGPTEARAGHDHVHGVAPDGLREQGVLDDLGDLCEGVSSPKEGVGHGFADTETALLAKEAERLAERVVLRDDVGYDRVPDDLAHVVVLDLAADVGEVKGERGRTHQRGGGLGLDLEDGQTGSLGVLNQRRDGRDDRA